MLRRDAPPLIGPFPRNPITYFNRLLTDRTFGIMPTKKWAHFGSIVDAACDAWRRLIADPARITSIGIRDWAQVAQSLCAGAVVSAVVLGIGGNVILTGVERRPTSSAEVTRPATTMTVNVPATGADSSQAETQAPALAAGAAEATGSHSDLATAEPSMPPVTASVQMGAAPAEGHASRTKLARIARTIRPPARSGELQSAARASDPIGVLLRGERSVSGAPVARHD